MTEQRHWDALVDRALPGEASAPAEARAILTAPDAGLLPLVAAVGRVRRAGFQAVRRR